MRENPMTEPMSDERLEAIKKIRDAANKGPWLLDRPPGETCGFKHGQIIAAVGRGQNVWFEPEGGIYPANNRMFIAESRTFTDELIAEIERLKVELVDSLEDHFTSATEECEIDGGRWRDSMSRWSYIGDQLVELAGWERHPTAGHGGRQFYRKKTTNATAGP